MLWGHGEAGYSACHRRLSAALHGPTVELTVTGLQYRRLFQIGRKEEKNNRFQQKLYGEIFSHRYAVGKHTLTHCSLIPTA